MSEEPKKRVVKVKVKMKRCDSLQRGEYHLMRCCYVKGHEGGHYYVVTGVPVGFEKP